jgi:hypothetical protein
MQSRLESAQAHAGHGPWCLLLPRDEMAFRKDYEPLLLGRGITAVFRPGNRVHPNRRGYIVGESVTARVIERRGCDRLGVPPLFNEVRIPIRITHLAVFFIDCVTEADFGGTSPDVFDRRSLIDHLERIYEEPIDSFNRTVTRIGFRYLDREPG